MKNDLTVSLAAADTRVTLEGVTKRYGALTAVDIDHLDVRAGEFLTLLGPSGCGKTTLLKIIAGFERPDAGRVSVKGRNITSLAPERRNFGVVFQGYALFPHLSVAENVASPLRRRRVSRPEIARRVAEALDLVRMSNFANRPPRQLSGGQQQRVALARAIVFEPDLVLLDEPLSALDAGLRQALQVELRSLHRETGMTFVCVTHDQDEALSLSDRIAVLRRGELLQLSTPDELYNRPVSEFVARFMGAKDLLRMRVESVEGGAARCRVNGQAIWCVSESGADVPGREVAVAIRPREIGLNKAIADNRVPARILARNFHGSEVVFTAESPVGELTLSVPAGAEEAYIAEGEAVMATWPMDAGLVVRMDD